MHSEKHCFTKSEEVREAFVFFHGFPGRFTKNEDLAVIVAAGLKADCYVPHFGGIGQSEGEFLFTKCLEESRGFLEKIHASGKYENINVIAHSWGAFVTLSILQKLSFKIKKLVLLAPLTFVPPTEALRDELSEFVKAQEGTGHPANFQKLISDLESIRSIYAAPMANPQFQIWPKCLVVQGDMDSVTPAAHNRPYFENRPSHISYTEVSDNHWLTNRQKLNELTLTFLKSADAII